MLVPTVELRLFLVSKTRLVVLGQIFEIKLRVFGFVLEWVTSKYTESGSS